MMSANTAQAREQTEMAAVQANPISFFHIDIAQVTTIQRKCLLFVAIDLSSKIAFARLYTRTTRIPALLTTTSSAASK